MLLHIIINNMKLSFRNSFVFLPKHTKIVHTIIIYFVKYVEIYLFVLFVLENFWEILFSF